MDKKQLFTSIPLFLALYALPTLVLSAAGVRGPVLVATSWGSFVVQGLLVVMYYRKRMTTAGFVGILALMAQVILYVLSNFTVLEAVTSAAR